MRQYLIVDLETVRNDAVPYTGEEKAGLLPAAPHHRIVVFGSLLLDAARHVIGYKLDVDERAGIARFEAIIDAADVQLVTFAGRQFDVPVISSRAFYHGIPMPRLYSRERGFNIRHRFDDAHIDLMDELCDKGAAPKPRLDAFTRLCGLGGKGAVDGGKVAQLVNEGRIEEVRTYCLEDLVRTTGVFLRWSRLVGDLDATSYLGAASALHAFCAAEPRLESFRSDVDWDRFSTIERVAGEEEPTTPTDAQGATA